MKEKPLPQERPRLGIFDWVLFIPCLLVFVSTLVIFELVQRITYPISKKLHEQSVFVLNFALLGCLKLIGTRIVVEGLPSLDRNKPYIIVSNHQSLFDVIILYCVFHSHRPRYVAKQELGQFIPSVTFNLRYGGNALIDRSDARQAIRAINALGERMKEQKFATVLFPEGTRARDGVLKPFKHTGFATLFKACQAAPIIPVAIQHSWKLMAYSRGPIPCGVKVKIKVGAPIERKDNEDSKELLERIEPWIRESL